MVDPEPRRPMASLHQNTMANASENAIPPHLQVCFSLHYCSAGLMTLHLPCTCIHSLAMQGERGSYQCKILQDKCPMPEGRAADGKHRAHRANYHAIKASHTQQNPTTCNLLSFTACGPEAQSSQEASGHAEGDNAESLRQTYSHSMPVPATSSAQSGQFCTCLTQQSSNYF